MKIGSKLFFCSECGKFVVPSKQTQKVIDMFDLTYWDIKIKCLSCKKNEYHALIRFVEGACKK